MSNKERAAHLLDTAEFEAFGVFDQCVVLAAKLENGAIMVEAQDFGSPEALDKESGIRSCMERLYEKIQAAVIRENTPAIPMTEKQAEIIIALVESNMVIKEAAKKLNYHASSVSYQIGKIKEETGKDPKNFTDMCHLLMEARRVMKEAQAQ